MCDFRSGRRRKIATTICASSGGAIPESLHLDCWGAVEQADGFDIALTRDAPHEGIDKLFFVNLGGYDPAEFSELHKNILLVAPDAKAAKAKALARIEDWSLPHKDSLFEVEKAIDVTAQLAAIRILPEAHESGQREAVQVYLRLSADRVSTQDRLTAADRPLRRIPS